MYILNYDDCLQGKLQTHKIKDISCEKIDICQQCNKQNAELECEDCELSKNYYVNILSSKLNIFVIY